MLKKKSSHLVEKVKGQGRHVEKKKFFVKFFWSVDVMKRSKVKRVKVKGHKRSR